MSIARNLSTRGVCDGSSECCKSRSVRGPASRLRREAERQTLQCQQASQEASAYYESISQEVASTNAVVQQLGTLLNDKKHHQLFGPESLRTTTISVTACDELFKDLNSNATPKIKADGGSTAKSLAEWKHRLLLPYKQADLERKQFRLKELKATLTLNLNIIVLAAQISLHDNR